MSRANIMQAVLDDMRPWHSAAEDRAMRAWRAIESLEPSDAVQERAIIAAMHEKLTAMMEDGRG